MLADREHFNFLIINPQHQEKAYRKMISIRDVVAKIADWKAKDVQIHKLFGGLTNQNYRVVVNGRNYMVRIPGSETELLLIDRKNEYKNSVIAGQSGVAPKVIYYLKSEEVMVQEFIQGKNVTIEMMHSEASILKVAESVHRLHQGPAFSSTFNMFRVMGKYIKILKERKIKISEGYLEEGQPAAKQIEIAVNKHPQPLVACHNDIWPENIIDYGSKFYIIDFELSGNNDPYFDLGNIAAECDYNEDQMAILCKAYCGHEDPAKIARIQLYAMMSDLGWTGWTLIQNHISSVDFDYWKFANFRWERARKKIHSDRFAIWLETASPES